MRFSKIKDNDVANGTGITMSLWTQGCPHHCEGCFNEETWNYQKGQEFTSTDLQYILSNINENGIDRNFAVLGGEPLCPPNIEGVIDVCKQVKLLYPNKEIYVWTGYTFEILDETQKKILKYIDVLIDGRYDSTKRNLSLNLRGSFNQRVIDVKKSLIEGTVILSELNK